MSIDLFSNEPDLERLNKAYSEIASRPRVAIAELEELADGGSMMSMMYLAEIYDKGRGVEPSPLLYEEWLKKAKLAGSAYAAFRLGKLYVKTKNYDAAIQEFLFSASLEFLPAIARMGHLYSSGVGIPRDFHKARPFLEKAYVRGHISGTRALSKILFSGPFGISQKLRSVYIYIVMLWYIIRLSYKNRKIEGARAFRFLNEQIH